MERRLKGDARIPEVYGKPTGVPDRNTIPKAAKLLLAREVWTFIQVGESPDFRAASEALDMSTSRVVAHIESLQELLGRLKLVEKRGRGTQPILTDEGKNLLPHAKALRDNTIKFVNLADGYRQDQEERADEVRIAGNATATEHYLPRILGGFRDTHPGVRLEVWTYRSQAAFDQVKLGHCDFAIVSKHVIDGDQSVSPSKLDKPKTLLTDEMQLLCKFDDVLAHKSTFDWSDLKDRAFWWLGGSVMKKLISSEAQKRGCDDFLAGVKTAGELPTNHSIIEAVRGGKGLAFLPTTVFRQGSPDDGDGLCLLRFWDSDRPLKRELVMVRRDETLRAGAQRLWDHLCLHTPAGS